jgi:hypothetical protein
MTHVFPCKISFFDLAAIFAANLHPFSFQVLSRTFLRL